MTFSLQYAKVSGVRTGSFGGQNPPLKILKEMKTSLFGTNRLFHTEIAEIALMFFYAIQLVIKSRKTFIVME